MGAIRQMWGARLQKNIEGKRFTGRTPYMASLPTHRIDSVGTGCIPSARVISQKSTFFRYGLRPLHRGWKTALLLTVFFLLIPALRPTPLTAQEGGAVITFGETVSGALDSSTPSAEWTFDSAGLELVEITVGRISGRLTPRVTLIAPDGSPLTPTEDIAEATQQRLTFLDGLRDAGVYTLRVEGQNLTGTASNPDEYRLTLLKLGERNPDRLADLSIPFVDALPALETGTSPAIADERVRLNMPIYGDVDVVRPEPGNRPAYFNVTGADFRITDLNNGTGLNRVVRSISFVPEGIGLVSAGGIPFFTDQNITRIENTAATLTVTLASGQTITTDFYRLTSIQAVDEVVTVETVNGNTLILGGGLVTLLQEEGGENNRIGLENDQQLITDLNGWDLLAYLPQANGATLSVLDGENFRLFSDVVRGSLLYAGEPGRYNLQLEIERNRAVTFDMDTARMGDVLIQGGNARVLPLDGRDIQESLSTLAAVVIESAGVRFERADGSYRTSLPDTTEIETPPQIPDTEGAIPGETGFRPRGFNNLGGQPLPTCPCIDVLRQDVPVNPANGNFSYQVMDFNISGHLFDLGLTRHYNSLPGGATPAYLLTTPYLFGQVGQGWRHTYQIELDLTNAPIDEVALILPEGTRHSFRADAGTADAPPVPNRFLSETAAMWRLERLSGVTGAWRATRTDGLTYAFDRAGRLERIINPDGFTLDFSPMPSNYSVPLNDGEAGGFLVIEPYGRRLIVFTDADGLIKRVRDINGFEITYTHNGAGELIGAVYVEGPAAEYTYQEGRLAALRDPRSREMRALSLAYDTRGRVATLTDETRGRVFTFSYENAATSEGATFTGALVTLQSDVVAGQTRLSEWVVDGQGRILRYITPREAEGGRWYTEFEYSTSNPNQLVSYRPPEGFRIRFDFGAAGNLLSVTDPIYTSEGSNRFTYTVLPDGHRLRLDSITYGNTNFTRDVFTYDANNRLSSRAQLISGAGREAVEYITRYEWDEFGRLIAVYRPGADGSEVATTYSYDDFGYVREVMQGNGARTYEFSHDLAGRLLSITDGRGTTTTLTWDLERNLITGVSAPLDYEVRYAYNDFGDITQVTDRGAVTAYTHDDAGNITSQINPLGQQTDYTYDEADNLLSMLLPDGQARYQYGYDALGNLRQVETPTGLIQTYNITINAAAGTFIRSVVDSAGRTGEYWYDGLGRLTQVNLEDRNERTVENYTLRYDAGGTQVTVERINAQAGRNLEVTYNLLGWPLQTSLNGTATRYSYNPAGWLASVTDPSGRVTGYEYDALGNITRVTLPGDAEYPSPSTTYTYDENGNRLTATAPDGAVTEFVYDELNRIETVIDPLGRETTYNYDARGNLVSITDPRGSTRAATYDDLDRLTSLRDPLGNELAYQYDNLGRLTEVTQGLSGFSQRFTYDSEDNLIALTQPGNRNTLYGYDALGRLTSATDGLGHTVVYTYDRLDRINRVIDPVGNITEYRWSTNGRLRRLFDPLERLYEYVLDPVGRLRQITDLNDQNTAVNTRLEYDEAGYLQEVRFGNGSVLGSQNDIAHLYEYTPQGWLSRYTNPEGGVWDITYDLNGRVTEVSNPNSVRTRYAYDIAGQLESITRAAGSDVETVENYTYDENGNVIRAIAPDGVVSEYSYNVNNQLTQWVWGVGTPDERTYFYDYNALGYLSLYTDAAGNVTEYLYNVFGDLEQVNQTVGEGEEARLVRYGFIYDQVGNLTGSVLPEGFLDENSTPELSIDYRTNYTYNALDLRVRYVDAEDYVYAYTYNAGGQLLEVSDPLGSVTRYAYDAMGRIVGVQYPNGAVVAFRYDNVGNLNRLDGAETDVITFQGSRESVRAERVYLTYQVDREGNLESVADINNTLLEFTYDALGNPLTRRDALGNQTRYTYDAHGRLIQAASPDRTINRLYDAAGNLTQVSAPGEVHTFTYNPFGEVIAANGPTINLTYTRDAAGNVVIREADALGATEYTYDNLYRLIRIAEGDVFAEFTYNRNGWLTGITRSNGVSTLYDYDTNGRPITVAHRSADNPRLDFFTYVYDSVGNIVRINRGDGWSVLFSYDVAHQVINERWLDNNNITRYAVNIRYDQAGNRAETLITEEGRRDPTRTLFVYDRENQLVQEVRNYEPPELDESWIWPLGLLLGGLLVRKRIGRRGLALLGVMLVLLVGVSLVAGQNDGAYVVNYTYDDAGNLTAVTYPEENGGELAYRYDAENRLVAVQGVREDGREVNTTYEYDALNRLAGWRTPEAQFRFLYDGDVMIGMENILTGERTRFMSLPSGERLMTSGEGQSWLLPDALGSVRRVADAGGAVIGGEGASYDFTAFGEQIAPYGVDAAGSVGDVPTPLFTGQLFDPTTGLYLMGARAYNPVLGRFIQRDPLHLDPQGTLYTFAYNRPTVLTDPTGLTPESVLRGTRAPLLPQDIQPQPAGQPLLPDVPTPPTVHDLQAEENYRILEVTNAARLNLNEIGVLLDPALDTFYIYRVNPAARAIQAQAFDLPTRMQNTYQEGWGLLAPPDPAQRVDPFTLLRLVDPLLHQADVGVLRFCEPVTESYLALPQIPLPMPLSERRGDEAALLNRLEETPLLAGILPEIEALTATPATLPEVAPAPPAAIPPQEAINPVVIERVDALMDRQRGFLRETLFLE